MGTKSIGNGPKMVFLSAEIYKSVVPNPFVTADQSMLHNFTAAREYFKIFTIFQQLK